MDPIEHRQRPCTPCPWRQDTDLANFSETDFHKLARANGQQGAEASLDAPMMACHLDQPGTAHAMRLCAGWLAVVGYDHLGVRFHVAAGNLPPECLHTAPDWPVLHPSLDEMLRHRPHEHHGTPTEHRSNRTGPTKPFGECPPAASPDLSSPTQVST